MSIDSATLRTFVEESNRIEGIFGPPTPSVLDAHAYLFALPRLSVSELQDFVRIVAGAKLREEVGMNVRVGGHVTPPGGPDIMYDLAALLANINAGVLTPYQAHMRYEKLHPFMDGNGRSGRAVWVWQMLRDGQRPFSLPFLHAWYYQSLDGGR